MINILYVHSSDNLYGSDQSLLRLIERLDREKYKAIVVISNDVTDSGLLSSELKNLGVKVVKAKLAVLRQQYYSIRGFFQFIFRLITSTHFLIRLMRTEKIQIVHSNTSAVYSGAFAAKFSKIPHIWHVREIILNPNILKRVNSWIIPALSTRIIANSMRTKDSIVGNNPRNLKKTEVIYNGIDLPRFDAYSGSGQQLRKAWEISDKTMLIGMVGRISYRKGQEYFVSVASDVLEKHPNAKFVIVGGTIPGHENVKSELIAQVSQLEISGKVIIEDFREDIPAVMDALDVFVLPSILPESFGNVILEAMAMKKPVVANAHGGSIEIVDDDVTGFLVKPNDLDAMTEALCELIENPQKRIKMGLEGRRRVENCFSLDLYISSIQDLYNDIIGRVSI